MNKLFIILFCFCFQLNAQEIYDHKLDKNKLESIQKNIQYKSKKPLRWTYESDREWKNALKKYDKKKGGESSKRVKGYESRQMRPERSSSNFKMPDLGLGPVVKIIIYVILGGLLVLLLYYLFINSSFKSNGKKYKSIAVDLEDIAPQDIPKTELERLLEEALKQHDFRKAVRIYYLFILKDLSEKKWIDWKKQKTNMHYIMEMTTKQEHKQFSNAVTYFEFIWYGERTLTPEQFKQVQPNFTRLLNTLGIK